uniref:Uncharacterized protein n=1 Tax=Alexandrium andersonii TaxID=327968 RepID=A0A7S2AE65_9DINO
MRPGTAVNALDFAAFKQSVLRSHSQLRERIVRIEGMCSALASAAPLASASSPAAASDSTASNNVAASPSRNMDGSPTIGSDAIMSFSVGQLRGDSSRHSASPDGGDGLTSFSLDQSMASSSRPGPLQNMDWPKKRINAGMLEDLERTPSEDIINELQRRLGVARLDEFSASACMPNQASQELQSGVRSTEAFESLGVPQQESDWREEVLTC